MRIVPVFILCSFFLHGQSQTDTLYANQSHSLVLFFPSPIRQAVAGSGNFTFSYNRESFQNFGLLQAIPGPESNLLVVTNDGQLYSFVLKYKKKLPLTTKFIELEQSIGHEKQAQKFIKPEGFEDTIMSRIQHQNPLSKKRDYFENVSSDLLQERQKILYSKKKGGIVLRLRKIHYQHREVYLVIEIANKSGIDFELKYLKVFKVNGNKTRKSSYQKRRLIPIYAHSYQVMIKKNTNKGFVYVIPKFTLGDSEKLLFELAEKRGSRNVNLSLNKIVP